MSQEEVNKKILKQKYAEVILKIRNEYNREVEDELSTRDKEALLFILRYIRDEQGHLIFPWIHFMHYLLQGADNTLVTTKIDKESIEQKYKDFEYN